MVSVHPVRYFSGGHVEADVAKPYAGGNFSVFFDGPVGAVVVGPGLVSAFHPCRVVAGGDVAHVESLHGWFGECVNDGVHVVVGERPEGEVVDGEVWLGVSTEPVGW